MPLPRRVPSLARFTRGARFRRLRAGVAPWIGGHFEFIEARAPWLSLAGQEVSDACWTSLTTRALSFPRDRPSVQCGRAVLRVYGADGSLPARLSDLAAVIGAAGWGHLNGDVTVPLSGLERMNPPTQPIPWRPAGGFRLPDGLEVMPAARQFPTWRWVHMQIGWASREQSDYPVSRFGQESPEAQARRTPIWEPLETSARPPAADAARLALAAHEHAIAIRIEFSYYLHMYATRGPGRLPVRILPYRPRGFSLQPRVGPYT